MREFTVRNPVQMTRYLLNVRQQVLIMGFALEKLPIVSIGS